MLRPTRFVFAFILLALVAPPSLAAKQQKPKEAPKTEAVAAPAAPVDPNAPPTIDTAAPFAYVIDANTGAVLLDKNGDQRMTPSSMTKMVTAYLVFEKLKRGELKMEDELAVSEYAWKTGGAGTEGSTMFLELNSKVAIKDLLRGIIVSSGNDACIVLAEGLAGSVESFAEQMNALAQRLGMTGSHFTNPDGLPDPNHYSTPHDLAVIARHTIQDFPEYYSLYDEKSFTYGKTLAGEPITQGNRNPLLYSDPTADGLKTGHLAEAGYGLTGSSIRNGRRVILVLNGMKSMKERAQESGRVMEWAFREWENYMLFKGGDVVEQAEVWLGQQPSVPLVAGQPLIATLPRKARRQMQVSVRYDGPIPAPIKKGDVVGKLTVTAPGIEPINLPLVAGADVPQLGMFGRAAAALSHVLFGGRPAQQQAVTSGPAS